MKKYISGIFSGIIAGIINCLFLLFAKDLQITVFASTFISWIVIGLLISATDFKMNGILKGIVISLLVSLPALVYTISSTFFGAIWNILITLIVGAMIGYAVVKINKSNS